MRRGRRDHRLGLSRRVVVASEGEQPLGVRCREQAVERDPGNDAPALGYERCFTRKNRFRDHLIIQGFRLPLSIKSKLENAVRGCHMEFVVKPSNARRKSSSSCASGHEGRRSAADLHADTCPAGALCWFSPPTRPGTRAWRDLCRLAGGTKAPALWRHPRVLARWHGESFWFLAILSGWVTV